MKKIFLTIIYFISISQSYANNLEEKMKWTLKWRDLNIDTKNPLEDIIKNIESIIYTILGIVAVWVFIFFWIKLITSRWNEDAFKKAKTWLIYAVWGLAIIPLAMALVKLASSLKL